MSHKNGGVKLEMKWSPQFYIKILALLIVFEILYNHIYTKVLPTLYRKSFTWGQSLSLFVALFCSFCYVFILFVSSQFITICGFTFFLEIEYNHHVLYCFRMKVLLLGKKGRMAVFKKNIMRGWSSVFRNMRFLTSMYFWNQDIDYSE